MKAALFAFLFVFSTQAQAQEHKSETLRFSANLHVNACVDVEGRQECSFLPERDHEAIVALNECRTEPAQSCTGKWVYERTVEGRRFRAEFSVEKSFSITHGKTDYFLRAEVGPAFKGGFISSTTMRMYLTPEGKLVNAFYLDSTTLIDDKAEWKAVLSLEPIAN